MKCILLLSMLVLIGCNSSTSGKSYQLLENAHPLKLRCVEIGPVKRYLYRCENSEVICYTYTESLQCQFKGDQ